MRPSVKVGLPRGRALPRAASAASRARNFGPMPPLAVVGGTELVGDEVPPRCARVRPRGRPRLQARAGQDRGHQRPDGADADEHDVSRTGRGLGATLGVVAGDLDGLVAPRRPGSSRRLPGTGSHPPWSRARPRGSPRRSSPSRPLDDPGTSSPSCPGCRRGRGRRRALPAAWARSISKNSRCGGTRKSGRSPRLKVGDQGVLLLGGAVGEVRAVSARGRPGRAPPSPRR